MYQIKTPSVANAYEKLMELILKEGSEIITEDGQKCKELFNVCVEITNPKLKRISGKYPFGSEFIESYTNNLLYGSTGNFVYDYYERIRKYPSYDRKYKNDQIEYIINKLKNNPQSRRCVVSLWQPFIDQNVKDVPCLQHICFQLRDNNLYMTSVFRSNDIGLAFHSNALGLIKLGELVANELNCNLKNYVHFIYNAHIYIDRDRDIIERYFDMK